MHTKTISKTKKALISNELQMALFDGENRMMRTNRHVPLVMGILSLSIAAYLAIFVGGIWGIGGAALLAMFGIPSIKTALFASDREINELTDPDLSQKISKETLKKFEDRI